MKNILIISLLLLSFTFYGQSFISIKQDIKLAVKSDDYGNTPFTTDVIFEFQHKNNSGGLLLFSYEFANLRSKYHRLSFGGAYPINIWKFQFIPEFSTGVIYHKNWYFNSFGTGLTLSIPLNDKIAIGLYHQIVFRSEYNLIRQSDFFTLTYKFNNKCN